MLSFFLIFTAWQFLCHSVWKLKRHPGRFFRHFISLQLPQRVGLFVLERSHLLWTFSTAKNSTSKVAVSMVTQLSISVALMALKNGLKLSAQGVTSPTQSDAQKKSDSVSLPPCHTCWKFLWTPNPFWLSCIWLRVFPCLINKGKMPILQSWNWK